MDACSRAKANKLIAEYNYLMHSNFYATSASRMILLL
jgi:hypothetical protein